MQPGTIVEYIDHKQIITAAVLEQKNNKLRMLTMQNREVSHGANRIALVSSNAIDVGVGRTQLVETLQSIAKRRETLKETIDLKDLWEVVRTESTWIDIGTLAELCFDTDASSDHTSSIMRAVFEDRLYFKFDTRRFFPNSPDKVSQIAEQIAAEEKKARLISTGSDWIKETLNGKNPPPPGEVADIQDILASFYLFGKDSPDEKTAKELISRSGLHPTQGIFDFLVQVGVWDKNENLTLKRLEIPCEFPTPVVDASADLVRQAAPTLHTGDRRDLRHLPTITIDGQNTLDFDDAISIQPHQGGCKLWIHVTDVCHFLKRGDPIDEEAMGRASSIYLPDRRISMLPPLLTEDLCSLKQDQDRLAITVAVQLADSAEVRSYDIFPSIIRVDRQLTYVDANQEMASDGSLASIYEYSRKLNARRLALGALQIDLPEVNIWIDDNEEIRIGQTNRESPSRLMVSESMILANWLMACYFRDRGQPAIFRSQSPPRQRLFEGKSDVLHQNWMQRRFLSRVSLKTEPEPHAGLGLDSYLTITSPLRKYLDLVTQRQLRGILGLEDLYSEDELAFIIQAVREPLSHIVLVQQERKRYWILKYLEDHLGEEEKALVLEKRRRRYIVLLVNYMMEASIPIQTGNELLPEETITVSIDQADARTDRLVLSVV